MVGVGRKRRHAKRRPFATWSGELLLVPTHLGRLLIRANDFGLESFFHFVFSAVGHSPPRATESVRSSKRGVPTKGTLIVALASLIRLECRKIVLLPAMSHVPNKSHTCNLTGASNS